jgi:hypothetical protein
MLTIAAMRDQKNLLAWLAAIMVSTALVLPSELNRHHYAAHKLGPRIVAGVLIWVAIATIVRLVIFLGARLVALVSPRG